MLVRVAWLTPHFLHAADDAGGGSKSKPFGNGVEKVSMLCASAHALGNAAILKPLTYGADGPQMCCKFLSLWSAGGRATSEEEQIFS